MQNLCSPHSDGAILADPETPLLPEPPSALPEISRVYFKIDMPGRIGAQFMAQGSAPVVAVIALLMAGLLGLGGSAFLNNDQPNLSPVERKEPSIKSVD